MSASFWRGVVFGLGIGLWGGILLTSALHPAQGIEAEGRDPSSGLDAERESPVANGDAPPGSNPP